MPQGLSVLSSEPKGVKPLAYLVANVLPPTFSALERAEGGEAHPRLPKILGVKKLSVLSSEPKGVKPPFRYVHGTPPNSFSALERAEGGEAHIIGLKLSLCF